MMSTRVSSVHTAEHSGEAFVKLFFENPTPMWIYDKSTLRFLEVNKAAVQRYGYSREQFLGMTVHDIRPRDEQDRLDREILRQREGPGRRTGYRSSSGWVHLARNGERLYADIYSQDIEFNGHAAVLVVVHDVTRMREIETQLRRQAAYTEQLFHNSPDAIVLLDCDDRVVSMNQSFCELFRLSPENTLGRHLNDLIVPPDRVEEARALSSHVVSQRVVSEETVRQRSDGSRVVVSILGYPVLLDGEVTGIYAVYRDVTERRRIADELAFHASHDPLTGLINRRQLSDTCRELINDAVAGSRHAFLYIDLDQFKLVNDTCGHVAGDQLLIEVAKVFRRSLRDSDVVGRLGGDEFAIVLRNCALGDAGRIAEKLIRSIRELRFEWEGQTYLIGASIGVAAIDRTVPNFTALMSRADAACYFAKEHGRNRYHVYREDDTDLKRVEGEMSWAVKLQQAIEQDRFELFAQIMQPLAEPYAARARKHLELLIRYREPDGTLVPPGAFIPAAERYSLMPQIDRWVISRAFDMLAAIRGELPVASINLSGLTFVDPGLIEFVRDEFGRTGIPSTAVCFEITETAAITNLDSAKRFIERMREMGVMIALDDFGSGMSSFNYLKSLPIDLLKIDGSFIRELDRNPVDYSMTEAINRLGHLLHVRTVAEFVESNEILDKLRVIGVDFAQGYAIHRPELWKIDNVAG